MVYATAWIFEMLLRLLLPPSGRHRAADLANGRPAVRHQGAPTMRPARLPDAPTRPVAAERVDGSVISFRPVSLPPDGRGVAAMVRPYVVAHKQQWDQRQWEQRAEHRLRRQRRRTLRLAAHGIDIRPRVIHGVRSVA
jgi:hypothetical protein